MDEKCQTYIACMYNSVGQRVANLVQRIQLGYIMPSGAATVVFLLWEFLALSSTAQVTYQ